MKKKILFVITKATWGGAQKYVYESATKLSREEFEPVVACGTDGLLVEKLRTAGIEVRAIPSLARDVALLSDITSFFQILRCIRGVRPDVVDLNSSKAAAFGALAARVCGVRKIIFTVHGWPFKEDRNVFARAVIYIISWLTSLLCTEVRVVSTSDEALGKRMWGVGEKVRYSPLSIDTPAFLSRDEAAAALGIRDSLPRIVSIAELTKNKGIVFALDAVAELRKRGVNVAYFIIGSGEERRALEEHVQKLGIEDRVHFLGFVENAAVYLKAFDLFLLPSIKEGMPYVLLEAAAAELPIVTTDAVDPAFLQSSQSTWRVARGVPRELASAIEEALSKPAD